jgi:hypothetical protein
MLTSREGQKGPLQLGGPQRVMGLISGRDQNGISSSKSARPPDVLPELDGAP